MIRMIGYREVCPFESVKDESARCSGSAWAANRLEAWYEYREHMRLVHGIPVGEYDPTWVTDDVAWNAGVLSRSAAREEQK